MRTAGPAPQIASDVRQIARELDPGVVVGEVAVLRDVVERETAPWRFAMRVLTGFGVLAAALAAVGLLGLVSLMVAMRQRELGIRAALGATPARLRVHVLAETFWPAVVGTGVGVMVVAALGGAIDTLLVGTPARDPVVIAGAAFATLAVRTGRMRATHEPRRCDRSGGGDAQLRSALAVASNARYHDGRAPVDIQVVPAPDDLAYRVDANARITFVNDRWDDFARDNGAPELARRRGHRPPHERLHLRRRGLAPVRVADPARTACQPFVHSPLPLRCATRSALHADASLGAERRTNRVPVARPGDSPAYGAAVLTAGAGAIRHVCCTSAAGATAAKWTASGWRSIKW